MLGPAILLGHPFEWDNKRLPLHGAIISDKFAMQPTATPVCAVILVLCTSLRSRCMGSYCWGMVGCRHGDTSSSRIERWIGR